MILKPNNATTVEQNKRLLSIGISEEYSDETFMYQYSVLDNPMIDKTQRYAFSITKLIDLLPDSITINNCKYVMMLTKYNITYAYYDDVLFVIDKKKDIGLINNAYIEMIIETFEYLYNNNLWKIN